MSYFKCFSLAGKSAKVALPNIPEDCYGVAAQMDDDVVPKSFFIQCGYFTKPFFAEGLMKHDSDELLVFCSSDPDNSIPIDADIEIQVGNDVIKVPDSCSVFVPKGVAHGNLNIKSVNVPVFYYVVHMNKGKYSVSFVDEATEEKGKHVGNMVEGYHPVSGFIPQGPEGFLTLILWLDGQKTAGAPYMETAWFKTPNMTGPAPHAHDDFDELIGFIGTDANNPTSLNGEVQMDIDGELVSVTESCVCYLPRGLMHSPILVPKLEKPLIHFSIGNGGDYARDGDNEYDNEYVPENLK